MKLSEAILLGSMKQPKITGKLVSSQGTCALGAALDGTGKLDKWKKLIEKYENVRNIPMYETDEFWKGYYEDILAMDTWFPAPYTEGRFSSRNRVINIIVLLNDSIGWSRENIAKWVSTIEDEIEEKNKIIVNETIESKELVNT